MKCQRINVNYRDAVSKQNGSLGHLEVRMPETIEEAIQLLGVERLMKYARERNIREQRLRVIRENRPRPKRIARSPAAKFRQLSRQEQEELLKFAGIV